MQHVSNTDLMFGLSSMSDIWLFIGTQPLFLQLCNVSILVEWINLYCKNKPWKNKKKNHKCMFLNLNFFLNQFNESLYMHCITRFWFKKAQEWKFNLRVIWYCQRLACYIMIVTEMSICSIIRWLWCLAGVFLCGFISAV